MVKYVQAKLTAIGQIENPEEQKQAANELVDELWLKGFLGKDPEKLDQFRKQFGLK
jgi:hypothetical protein